MFGELAGSVLKLELEGSLHKTGLIDEDGNDMAEGVLAYKVKDSSGTSTLDQGSFYFFCVDFPGSFNTV